VLAYPAGELLFRFSGRVRARVAVGRDGRQSGEEARPAVIVQQAEVSRQAVVNQAQPGPAGVIAIGGERHLDP
jgi:hypothetical protein